VIQSADCRLARRELQYRFERTMVSEDRSHAEAEGVRMNEPKKVPSDLWRGFYEFIRERTTDPRYADKCCESAMAALASILLRSIRFRCGPVSGVEPEDICQDILISMLKILDALCNEQEFQDKFASAGQLIALAKTKAYYRTLDLSSDAMEKREVLFDDHFVVGDELQEAVEPADRNATETLWNRMRELLTVQQLEALEQRFFAEQPYKEIARQMNLTEDAAKMLVYRAKKKLIDGLCPGDGEGPNDGEKL